MLIVNYKVKTIYDMFISEICLGLSERTRHRLIWIHLKESKSTDIHGVICETTKLATSKFETCDFETSGWWGEYGLFSFKPTNSSDKIKCSKLFKTGLQNIEISYLIYSRKLQYCWRLSALFRACVITNNLLETLLTRLFQGQNVNHVVI